MTEDLPYCGKLSDPGTPSCSQLPGGSELTSGTEIGRRAGRPGLAKCARRVKTPVEPGGGQIYVYMIFNR